LLILCRRRVVDLRQLTRILLFSTQQLCELLESNLAIGPPASGDCSFKNNSKIFEAVLEATSGPHTGEKWVVEAGSEKQPKIYCIGSHPSKRNCDYIVLSKDSAVAANHAQIKLHYHKRLFRINVWNLTSKSGTLVGEILLVGTAGKAATTAAYNCGVIQVGDTELKVLNLAPKK
jgi:hypothetical protein